MELLTHIHQIENLPPSPLKQYIQRRFLQYTHNPEEVPPVFILLETPADLSSEELNFLGSAKVCSDLFDSHTPGDKGFQSVFDWICFQPDLKLYELMYIEGDLGYWVMCPEEIVEACPDLKLMISSQELSDPQPLF